MMLVGAGRGGERSGKYWLNGIGMRLLRPVLRIRIRIQAYYRTGSGYGWKNVGTGNQFLLTLPGRTFVVLMKPPALKREAFLDPDPGPPTQFIRNRQHWTRVWIHNTFIPVRLFRQFKGTVLWDRFIKCCRKLMDLGLNKGRGWFFKFFKGTSDF